METVKILVRILRESYLGIRKNNTRELMVACKSYNLFTIEGKWDMYVEVIIEWDCIVAIT